MSYYSKAAGSSVFYRLPSEIVVVNPNDALIAAIPLGVGFFSGGKTLRFSAGVYVTSGDVGISVSIGNSGTNPLLNGAAIGIGIGDAQFRMTGGFLLHFARKSEDTLFYLGTDNGNITALNEPSNDVPDFFLNGANVDTDFLYLTISTVGPPLAGNFGLTTAIVERV